MNILFLDVTGIAYNEGGAKTRIISELEHLDKKMFKVYVLCFVKMSKYFQKRKQIKNFKTNMLKKNITVATFPMLPLKRSLFVKKLNRLYSAFICDIYCLLNGHKIIHAQTSHASGIAVLCKKYNKKLKIIADIHGIEPEEFLLKTGLPRTNKHYNYLEHIDKKVLLHADWNIYVSKRMHDFFSEKYKIQPKNYSIIPCVPSIVNFNLVERSALRKELGIDNKIVFLYMGSLDKYQLIHETVKLFNRIREDFTNAFLLVLTFQDAMMKSIIREEKVNGEDFRILKIDQLKIARYIQIADFGFLLRDNINVNNVASPVKFGEYCASGVPVLSTKDVGDISSFITEFEIGFIVDPREKNIAKLKLFIDNVMSNRKEFAKKCTDFIHDRYNWEKYILEIQDIYENVAQKSVE